MGFLSGIGHAISSGVKSIGRVASGAFNTVKDFAGGTLGHMIGGAAQGYANGGFGGMFSGIMSSLGGAKGSSPDMFSGLGSALGSYLQARNSGGHLSGFKLDLGSGSDLYNGVGGTTQFTPQPVKTAAEQGADTRAYLGVCVIGTYAAATARTVLGAISLRQANTDRAVFMPNK